MSTFTREIDAWCDWLRAAGRAWGTVSLRRTQLRRLARAHPDRSPWTLDAEDLVRWLAHHEWDQETRRSHRSAVRAFWSWAIATGRTRTDVAAALPSVPARQGQPRPTAEDGITAALARADERDRVMILCGAEAGMRACEIATLHSDRL
ncbi:MAG: site-specific integrase, partial [Micrococcus sp.]|nr:site-specific integrase [Micrococcus sp.]